MTFTYNIQIVAHCRKFSMKQNVDVSCSLRLYFPFEPLQKCMTFKDIFTRTFKNVKLKFPELSGPKWFSRNF